MSIKLLDKWKDFECQVNKETVFRTRPEKQDLLNYTLLALEKAQARGRLGECDLASFFEYAREFKRTRGSYGYQALLTMDPNTFHEFTLHESMECFRLMLALSFEDLNKVLNNKPKDTKDLLNALRNLTQAQLERQYPLRDHRKIIEQFVTPSEWVKHPIKRDEIEAVDPIFIAVIDFLEKGQQPTHEVAVRTIEIIKGIQDTFQITPNYTQILGFLLIIHYPEAQKGRIGQFKTGEGKSTLDAMLLAHYALEGKFIDVVTVSDYLAIRDAIEFKPFFARLGLSCGHICEQNLQPKHFEPQILYGTNTDFEFAQQSDDLYQTNLRMSILRGQLRPRTYDYVLIDEVDSLFIDSAMNAAIMSIPGAEDIRWIYEPIFTWAQTVSTLTPEAVKKYLAEHHGALWRQAERFVSDDRIGRWLESVKVAVEDKEENRDYFVKIEKENHQSGITETKKIVIVNYQNTGRSEEGCEWQNGLSQFLQVKHGIQPTSESRAASSLSHPIFFNRYAIIQGVTGTMGSSAEREEIKQIYGVDTFDAPPYLPPKRTRLDTLFVDNQTEQFDILVDNIKVDINQNRAVLILCKTAQNSIELDHFLTDKGIKHQTLNGLQATDESYLIAKAGRAQTVTIATNLAGRGTNILLSKECEQAGGLKVYFLFYPINSRVEDQGFGRAGRKGQPGSGQMILSRDDDFVQALLKGMRPGESALDQPLLDQLRDYYVAVQSQARMKAVEVEKLFFGYLKTFYDKTRRCSDLLIALMKDPTPCLKDEQGTDDESLNHYLPEVLRLAQYHLGACPVVTDSAASLFIKAFRQAYLEKVRGLWANFYARLHTEIGYQDFDRAQAQVKSFYQVIEQDLSWYLEVNESMMLERIRGAMQHSRLKQRGLFYTFGLEDRKLEGQVVDLMAQVELDETKPLPRVRESRA